MIVKLTDREIIVLSMNFTLVLFGISYVMLSEIARFSLDAAETMYPMQEGLIYILYYLGTIAFETAAVIILLFDVWVLYLGYKEWRKDWL